MAGKKKMTIIILNEHYHTKCIIHTQTHALYSYEVLRFFATFDGYLRASTLRHADDIAILCSIGHEVAHVLHRIHVIPHPIMVNLYFFLYIDL